MLESTPHAVVQALPPPFFRSCASADGNSEPGPLTGLLIVNYISCAKAKWVCSGECGMDLTPEEGKQLAKQLQSRARTHSKRSAAPARLQHGPAAARKQRAKRGTFEQRWDKGAAPPSEAQRLQAVQDAIAVFEGLPAGSAYARHKLKVLHTALGLLQAG